MGDGGREPKLVRIGDEDVLVITRMETVKLVASPLRLRLLDLLAGEPRTVKELAATLAVGPTKLYYHLNLLVEHGLVRVASTRVVSGIIEKRYQAVAARLTVDRSLFAPALAGGGEGLESFLTVVLDGAKSQIGRAIAAGLIDAAETNPARRGLVLGRRWLRLTPDQAQALHARLSAVLTDFSARQPAASADPHLYEVLLGLYPTVREGDGGSHG